MSLNLSFTFDKFKILNVEYWIFKNTFICFYEKAGGKLIFNVFIEGGESEFNLWTTIYFALIQLHNKPKLSGLQ